MKTTFFSLICGFAFLITSHGCAPSDSSRHLLEFDLPEFNQVIDATVMFEASIYEHYIVCCLNSSGDIIRTLNTSDYSKFPYRDYKKFFLYDVPRDCFQNRRVRIEVSAAKPITFSIKRCSLNPIYDSDNTEIENRHSIEGYTHKISYTPNEELELKVHLLKNPYSVTFVDLATGKELDQFTSLIGKPQNYPNYASIYGANWDTSFRFRIPSDWKSSLYLARLENKDGKHFHIPFIVADPSSHTSNRVVLVASTNTWQAYNGWGGASFYSYRIPDTTQRRISNRVHSLRPNPTADPFTGYRHLLNSEKFLLQWLEQQRIPYTVITDHDLDSRPDILSGSKTLMISTHSEYWTEKMYSTLEAFLNRGGNLISLSGNTAFYKAKILGNQLESRKDGSLHPDTQEEGGLWRLTGRPEARLWAIRYSPVALNTYGPYRVLVPDHWIFENTGLESDAQFGSESYYSDWMASGFEMDRLSSDSPPNTLLLASGINRRRGGAHMILYQHPMGGSVFNVGSVSFVASLKDPTCSKLLANVIYRFQGP